MLSIRSTYSQAFILCFIAAQKTRIVVQALLAIPDAPPACFTHRARQAPVLAKYNAAR